MKYKNVLSHFLIFIENNNFLSDLYHKTNYYKKRAEEKKSKAYTKKNHELIRLNLEKRINEEIELKVYNGPFKNMNYINTSSGSEFLPKIIGSYEEPIQPWVIDVINKKYRFILDIGCAEGYYAVGFALSCKETKVYAFDIDLIALKNLQKLIDLNNVRNVIVKQECTIEQLNSLSNLNTLIFCDIEGNEEYLLDPKLIPNLQFADIIVESHDCFRPGMTKKIVKRFKKTHRISIIQDYVSRKNSYEFPFDLNDEELNVFFDENRPPKMNFLKLIKL
jgi:precorrin-6B methylase 2